MITEFSKLTATASFWDSVSVVTAAFVFIGVVSESVSEFDTLARWTRLDRNEPLKKTTAKVGLFILIMALAVEVVAGIGSRNANEEIISSLNKQLDQTVRDEIELSKLTAKLQSGNKLLEQRLQKQRSMLRSINAKNNKFDTAIREQKVRDDKAIRSLEFEETRLANARKTAVENASQSAKAAEIAKTTAANMTETLRNERAMQEQMRDLVSERTLSEEQVKFLAPIFPPAN